MYKCTACGKKVADRHPYYDELCTYSSTQKHQFESCGDFSNDTKWSESLVGRYWKWVLGAIAIGMLLQWLGLF
jgi:hypothetical protein